MHVLLVKPPSNLAREAEQAVRALGGECAVADGYDTAAREAASGNVDAIIVAPPNGRQPDVAGEEQFEDLLRHLAGEHIPALLLQQEGALPWPVSAESRALIDTVKADISLDELKGRLATIDRYHALVQRLEHELRNKERLGKRLNQHFFEVDQEMRLASRLQRDFLPNLSRLIGAVQCAAIYRPASWVSGDIYDVFRVDEDHVAMYVADAVGHGMAASLLTMFIKRAIVPKRIHEQGYDIATPGEVLAGLNSALSEQKLPNCQFITAAYVLLNTRSMTLQYARGGHPYPLIFTTGGHTSELRSPGGLLGLMSGETYEVGETKVHSGEKILLYSDGVEMVFQDESRKSLDVTAYRQVFERFANHPVDEMMMHLEQHLDAEFGSLSAKDDITVVGMEIP